MSTPTATRPERRKHTTLPAVAASSLAGTAVEWYDFFLYGTAAALVFNKLFFPSGDPVVSTMLPNLLEMAINRMPRQRA